MISKIAVAVLCWSLSVPGQVAGQAAGQGARAERVEKSGEQAVAPAEDPDGPELLTPEEEETLAARSEEPGRAVAGGALSNQQITYILIALATAVVVLILK